MIFVIGGTGTVGQSLLAGLRAQGAAARVLVRDDEKARAVAEKGFEAVRGDLERPAEVEGALADVDTLFLLTSVHPRQAELQDGAVEAAKRVGVRRIVKLSGASAVTSEDSPSWMGRAHAQTERKIKHGGFVYTFLHPNYFMQNLLTVADPIRNGILPLAFGDGRAAMIDARDVGTAAASILSEDGVHDGQVYDLTGPESLSLYEVAERLSRVLGQEIRYADPPLEATAEGMRSRGMPEWRVEHVLQILSIMRSSATAQPTSDVENILGRPPRTLEEFARDYADAFGGSR